MRSKKTIAVAAVALSGALLAAGCGSSSSSNSSSGGGKSVNWANCVSVAKVRRHDRADRGGQEGGDAQRHHPAVQLGQLRQHHEGLHRQVRHQGHGANPEGSSQDEINAMGTLKGQSRAPDVLDMGTAFAIKADEKGLLAPTRSRPGLTSRPARRPPTHLVRRLRRLRGHRLQPQGQGRRRRRSSSLLKPIYKNQVAINNNPTQASAAFSAVCAAALANGGSFDNIQPGIDFFQS